jgi:hypothetical protein
MIYSLKNVVKFNKLLDFKYTFLLIILLSISIFYERTPARGDTAPLGGSNKNVFLTNHYLEQH